MAAAAPIAAGSRRGRPSRAAGTRWARCATASARDPARSNRGRVSPRSASRTQRGTDAGRASAREARVPAMSRPNGTSDGQADSQPRHSTQASMKPAKASSTGAPCSTTRIDAMRPTRRSGLLAAHPVGRAVREAEPAPHAGREVVGVEAQRGGRPRHHGTRPGLRRPVGSKAVRTRRCRSSTTGSSTGSGAGRSACTMPTPTSATNRPVSAARPGSAAQLLGSQRPTVGRQLRRSGGVDRHR